MKVDKARMMTRSRSRAAAAAKSVRIRSPSGGRSEPELMIDLTGVGSSADIPQKCQKSKRIRLMKSTAKKNKKKDNGSIQCPICPKKLKSRSTYYHHLVTSHYAERLKYIQWAGDAQSENWSCSKCDYSSPVRWHIISHLGSNKHTFLEEAAPPETSVPSPSRQLGGTQQPPQGLVITPVEFVVPAQPSEASASAEIPEAEAPVAVSPGIIQEPVGSTRRSSGDIRDLFIISDEESDDEMEAPSYRRIENLGSHIDTA